MGLGFVSLPIKMPSYIGVKAGTEGSVVLNLSAFLKESTKENSYGFTFSLFATQNC